MQRNEWDLPEPAGILPVKGPRVWRYVAGFVLVVGLFLASTMLPIPIFFAYLPGPVEDVENLITIEDAPTYSSEGTLYMTTVNVDTEVTLVEVIESFFDEDKEIVDKSSVTGGGSLDELRREQREQMTESQQHAREVALSALGLATPEADGVRVEGLFEGLPAAEVLEKGDVILGVDGQPIETTCDVGRLIGSHEIGDEVTLTIRRDGRKRTVDVDTAPSPQDPEVPVVGMLMEDINYRFDPGVRVEFDTGRIAGPSAGLMLTLGLYDRLTPGDLTAGRAIAGTGVIECDGQVGPIGGIQQKVAGAEQRGAEIFLTPDGNAAAAERAANEIQVVAVSSFSDALEFLQGLE